MSEDLKQIKKLYGESLCHFCRDYFASILEEKGLLPRLLQDNFALSHTLYDDLNKTNKLVDFKNYIYDLFHKNNKKVEVPDVLSPEELMSLAGYRLYECKNEEDIQKFKKYYVKGEELCTFKGERLKSCYVFFAIKENVSDINRGDYPNPERQDEYGTSVISIQFSRDNSHTLSIKNRYNHTVENPDATFGNNLDNIIEGLTESFEVHQGLKQEHVNNGFEIPGYVRAKDGRWYKYNYEINNIYYCPENIIITPFEIKRYPKEKYIIMDYFILDLVEKKIYLCDANVMDSFPYYLRNIKNISIIKDNKNKRIEIIHKSGEKSVIIIDGDNKIIGLESTFIKGTMLFFMNDSKALKKVVLPNLVMARDNFLPNALDLVILDVPRLELVGDGFLTKNVSLTSLNLPSLGRVGDYFLTLNESISNLFAPRLKIVGNQFLECNKELLELDLPSLEQVGFRFIRFNKKIKRFNLPKLKDTEIMFLNNHPDSEQIAIQVDERNRLIKK